MTIQHLYLTSSFSGPRVAETILLHIEELLNKTSQNIKVAYIITAGNLHPVDQRGWIDRGRKILQDRGWKVFDYDIANKSESEIESFLLDKDVIFIQGGQCIYMLEEVQKCNFFAIIKRALARGVPYIGESTGSIITGNDISPYCFLSKDRREKPPVLDSYQGMGLVNFLIRPHWNNQPKKESYTENIISNFEKFFSITEPMIFLNDNQLVYVEGDKFQIWEA